MSFKKIGIAYLLITALKLMNQYLFVGFPLVQLVSSTLVNIIYALAFIGLLLLYVKYSRIEKTDFMKLVMVLAIILVIPLFIGDYFLFTSADGLAEMVISLTGILSSIVSITGLIYTYRFASYTESKLLLTYVYASIGFIFIPFIGYTAISIFTTDVGIFNTYWIFITVLSNAIELLFIYFLFSFKQA